LDRPFERISGGARHSQTMLSQGRQIPIGLSPNEFTEAERPTGYLEVSRSVTHDLEKHPGRGATFVELTGRMQKSRAEPERRGDAMACPQRQTYVFEPRHLVRSRIDIGLDRDVVTG